LLIRYDYKIGCSGNSFPIYLEVQQGCPTKVARRLIAEKLSKSPSAIKIIRWKIVNAVSPIRKKEQYVKKRRFPESRQLCF